MALAHLISDVRAAGISFDEDDLEEAVVGREVSELELLTKRRRAEEQKKARHHWSLLRDSIRNVRKAVEQADARDVSLVHGIHHDRKLNHTYVIQHAIFIPQRKVGCSGSKMKGTFLLKKRTLIHLVLRIYLWWRLCNLYLLACQMTVSVGDSCLRCKK